MIALDGDCDGGECWSNSETGYLEPCKKHHGQVLDEMIEAEFKRSETMPEPYFYCVCGVRAFPLTDDTRCRCKDYYDQEWTRHPAVDAQ